MQKTIITVAVTGAVTTKDQNPNLPCTPNEIVKSVVESCREGAAIAHIHVRDRSTGKPSQDVKQFKEVISGIRENCDILINATTGGGPGLSYDERIEIIPELANAGLKPEIASLNAGSLNFGLFSRKKNEFVLDDVQMNPWSQIYRFANIMKENGVKPEIEIYDSGMINNAKVLHELKAIDAPLHFQFVLGVLGGLQPTIENLVFLKNSIPLESTWSICALGLNIFSLGAAAVVAGGHVRLGMEDGIYLSKGRLAESNAEMVAKMKRIIVELGNEVATPDEARKILNIK